ncbi:MAG: DUF2950 domain-containing protein [Planctomycetes bacterium]|nr:DUF2950 domain-containing protein [Planctomycetota bacterium]
MTAVRFSLREALAFALALGAGYYALTLDVDRYRHLGVCFRTGPLNEELLLRDGLTYTALALVLAALAVFLLGRVHAGSRARATALAAAVAFSWWLVPHAKLWQCRMPPRCQNVPISDMKAYAEAQDLYRRTDWDGDGVLEYACEVTGPAGLNRPPPSGKLCCGDLLVSEWFANAVWEPGNPGPVPKGGYFFKQFDRLSAHAPGGRKSYLDVNGNKALGYALLAWPARYGADGEYSFVINSTGAVYRKDLAKDTEAAAKAMTESMSGGGWEPVE